MSILSVVAFLQAGGFWVSDDRCIAIFGAMFLCFFLGIEVGEKRKKS
jgi:hypothetical protein